MAEQDDEAVINADAIDVAMKGERQRIGRFNLAIVGGTGVGKSSLVNAVFGEPRAVTGVGMPVTKGVSYHASSTGSFGVWDFEGFEIGEHKNPSKLVSDNLREISNGDPIRHIAVVWYCVSSSAARLTEADLEAIDAFHAGGLKVILVLTKVGRVQNPITRKWSYANDAVAFAEWLANPTGRDGESFTIPVEGISFTAAVDQGAVGGPAHGLDDLLLATFELSPDGDQDALKVAQRISMPMKRDLPASTSRVLPRPREGPPPNRFRWLTRRYSRPSKSE